MDRKVNLLSFDKRKFGFCDVEWLIENFCLVSCENNWMIQSPEFTVYGSEETKWLMTLEPRSYAKNSPLLFKLKRLYIDTGPVGIVANLRMRVSISNGKALCADDVFYYFKKGFEYEIDFKSIGYFLKRMEPFKNDLLAVRCTMIVYSRTEKKRFKACDDPGIKSLSNDMLNLFRTGQNCDTKLIIGNKVILAHKTVLCSSNEQLNRLFDKEDDSTKDESEEPVVIYCSHLGYKGLKKILAYFYSGDLDHVLICPSLAVYDCAIKLHIPELTQYYTADKLIFRSSMDIKEFTFMWIVKDFERRNAQDDYFFNPYFIARNSVTTCLLHFYHKSQISDYVYLFAEAFERTGAKNMCLEYSIADEFENFPVRFRSSIKDLKSPEFETFFKRNLVKQYLTENYLHVSLRLMLSMGIKNSYIDKQEIYHVDCIDEETHYFHYAMKMKDIYVRGYFSDVTFKNYGKHFPVHKCIIASRSSLIFKMIIKAGKHKKIAFRKIKPNILHWLLIYIYSGTVLSVPDGEVIELYQTAVIYKLRILKHICSALLQERSETNANIRCKVLKLAEENGDTVLKESVVRYLNQTIIPFESPVYIVFSLPLNESIYMYD